MEPMLPTSRPARHWRITIPVSLGILLLLGSLVVAAMSLDSPSHKPSTSSTAASRSTDVFPWCSLGYADIQGGVTQLYPMQPGRIKSIEARENEPVKAGEPLFQMEDTVQRSKARQAEAAWKGAQQQQRYAEARIAEADKQIAAQEVAIKAAKIKVDQAQVALKRQKRFAKDDIGDNEELQNAVLTVRLAEEGVRGEQKKLDAVKAAKAAAEPLAAAAGENVEAKQAQLEEAQNAVKECVVRAPVDGIPLRILVNVGQMLGTNPRQPAIQFAAQSPLLVRAEVEQEFAGHVRPGQEVVIQDHVTGQECGRGKVVSLALWYAPRRNASPDLLAMNNDVRTLECIIKIESKSREIRIGQRVRVQFPG